MAEPGKKGTVTSLSSLFPVDEAQKASKSVHSAIAEHNKELGQLREFIADNTNLVNLVQRLPDEIHHDVMVPFGKAAFFPGRLVHTNEFLVLLGEGYYSERTSKQTIDILRRRGKALESQVESLKVVIQDLKAEASFFDITAAEAAEGLVEIREDYVEETSTGKASLAGAVNTKVAVEDEEFARILSRIDELEKEEEEAENSNELGEDEQDEDDLGHHISRHSHNPEVETSEAHQLSNLVEQSNAEDTSRGESFEKQFHQDLSDQLNLSFEGSKVHHVSKDGSSRGTTPAFTKSNFTGKTSKLPEVKENVQAAPISRNEVSVHTSEPGSNSSEAFTGYIIEHTHDIEMNPKEQTVTRNSKPVSRFKMNRR